jgi:F-type H+-transporting ATPase subunit b
MTTMEIISNIALITINATLFHQLVAFLIFLFIINRIMFRPLRSVMAERDDIIEKIKLDTTNAGETIDRLNKDLKERESEVRKEAFKVQHELEEKGKQESAEIMKSTLQEIEVLKDKNEVTINAQIMEAKKDLQKESEALALNIMEKLLDRRLVS